jgi:PAS domain S-box-containing protein
VNGKADERQAPSLQQLIDELERRLATAEAAIASYVPPPAGAETGVTGNGSESTQEAQAALKEAIHILQALNKKHVEEALRMSEERFSKAFRASPDALVITRQADGRIFEINQSYERIFGYSREEAIGKTLPERLRLALFRIYQVALTNVIRHAQASRVDVRFHFDAERVVLEIQDDGRGFVLPGRWIEFAREGHLGLVGAAERAESVGWRSSLGRAKGRASGWPYPDNNA